MEQPQTTEPCYEEPDGLCRQVYDWTDGNETLANLTDWFIDTPLRIVMILIIAFIASRLARRWVGSVVTKVVAPTTTSTDRLERLGIDIPDTFAGPDEDPRRSARAHSISVVLTSTSIVFIWTIAGLMILEALGISLAPLLAGAGIAGVALGFGAQSLVKDCVAGFFTLLEDQYGVGDVVDLGEASGVVEEISLRATVLRSIDGTVWHVPNGVVARVGNLSQLWSVALIDVDVAYDTDLDRARELLQNAADEICELEEFREQILEPPSVLGVEALAADGISLRLTIKVTPGAQWSLQRAIRANVKQTFDNAGIEIPFPQRTVWMRVDREEPPQGDSADNAVDD